jgi:hypothetical protein
MVAFPWTRNRPTFKRYQSSSIAGVSGVLADMAWHSVALLLRDDEFMIVPLTQQWAGGLLALVVSGPK